MKSFYEYLSGVKREYKYKLKLAVPVDDYLLDKIERVLQRYDVIDVSKPKKAILQRNEIDFPGVGPVEAYTITIVTERPLVAQVLTNDLQKNLNISERFIRVRGANEPVQVEDRFAEEFAVIEDAAEGMTPAALLGTEEIDDSEEPAYGDNYNQKLLDYLAQIQSNRVADVEKATGHKSMFGWLETAQEDAAFNADHDGVRPVSGSTLKPKEADAPADTAPTGNFDSRIKHAAKTYKSDSKVKTFKGNE